MPRNRNATGRTQLFPDHRSRHTGNASDRGIGGSCADKRDTSDAFASHPSSSGCQLPCNYAASWRHLDAGVAFRVEPGGLGVGHDDVALRRLAHHATRPTSVPSWSSRLAVTAADSSRLTYNPCPSSVTRVTAKSPSRPSMRYWESSHQMLFTIMPLPPSGWLFRPR